MSERIPILLLEGQTRKPFEATLISGVSDQELAIADQIWQSFLEPILEARTGYRRPSNCSWDDFVDRAYEAAWRNQVSLDDLPEHSHWKWQRKQAGDDSTIQSFGIECDGQMQALMFARSDRLSRLAATVGLPLVYVDYLAAAPWNLSELTATPRYRRCGYVLMLAAINLSYTNNWNGVVGLHSLVGAEDFYRNPRKCGMVDLGTDPKYDDLRYFEMTVTQAQEFVQRFERGAQ